MTADQARQILHAAHGTSLEAMWMSMLYLGLRSREAAALSWGDIDFDDRIVHVRKARKRRRHDPQLERGFAANLWNNPNDLVFTNAVGSPTDPPKARAAFTQIITAAELGDGWTPNMLRHSAASLMSDAGISSAAVTASVPGVVDAKNTDNHAKQIRRHFRRKA